MISYLEGMLDKVVDNLETPLYMEGNPYEENKYNIKAIMISKEDR